MNYNSGEIHPEISVVLSVYNGGEYLKLSIESVLKQRFAGFEFLIIDDCSTDSSLEYLQSIKDERVKLYVQQENQGLFSCLNKLITKCNSSLIKLWSQDDIMYSGCLEKVVAFHKKHPDIGFSYTGRDMIDEAGKIRETGVVDNTPEIISTELHARIAYYTGSIAGNIANVCINKEALDKVGMFNDQMKISADFDMWVRLAKDHETGFIREKLIQLRDHDKQLSRNEKYYLNHVKEDLQVYRYLDGYVTNEQRVQGHKMMRKNKLIFYYTLMIKTLLKGNFKTAGKYFLLLSSYENILLITFNFVASKFLKRNKIFE